MRLVICLLIVAVLTGCSYTPLKSPCGPSASLSVKPCVHIPINFAWLNIGESNQS